MLNRMQSFSNMPAPLKIGLLVASGAGITAILYAFASMFSGNRHLFYIIFGGLALVACLLFLYWRIVKFLRKRKAAPLERGLKENTSATPQEISEATRMARLDDLRKKFETGIETFRSAGKNLYDFPWYLIVGEPGSGKTEAIRHCNIGFPPGLQDEFQGAGGTLNMNWWFTDHAVILDTAGRLMFEEVQAGQSSEWVEFLRLLKKSRSNCPVNGVLLAIPADSLIKDTADEIERKASKIARQFDLIQRTLDVRFPVFVVITKSDLITGFRDFFDKLEDPQLQHQILGWSNPSPLDEPYNPGFIEQHLTTICGRLFRRRLALMRHVADGDEMDAGLGQIDSLYAFPQGLSKLAPRMARYLELIFSVGNQWSGKPLFFRGIYFTSSMQEGSALDEDLAEALGVPVDSLPDGRAWMRDRAYFLRDLFMKKIFQEKGLVTRATNARKQHTRRKAVVLCSGILAVLILIAFTIYTAWGFNSNIDRLGRFFSKYTGEKPEDVINKLKVVKAENGNKYSYWGDTIANDLTSVEAWVTGIEGENPDDRIFKSGYHVELDLAIKTWEEKKGRWWLSRIAPGRIDSDRLRQAQKILYEQTVLIPFVDAACTKLLSDTRGTASETDIIKALMNLRFKKAYSSEDFLDPYMAYISGKTSQVWPDKGNDSKHLHHLLVNKDNDNIVGPPHDSLRNVRIRIVNEDGSSPGWKNWGKIDNAIKTGCDRLIERLSDPNNMIPDDDRKIVGNLKDLASRFEKYNEIELGLLETSLRDSQDQWEGKFATLQGLKEGIDVWFKSHSEVARLRVFSAEIDKIYEALDKSVDKSFQPLLGVLGEKSQDPPNPTTPAGDTTAGPGGKTEESASVEAQEHHNKLQGAMDEIKGKVKYSKTQLRDKCAQLDELFCKQLPSDNNRREYERRFDKYDSVTEVLGKTGFQAIAAAAVELKARKTNNRKSTNEGDTRGQDAATPGLSTSSGRLAAAELLYLDAMIAAAITNAPETVDDLYKSIKNDSLRQDAEQKKFDPEIAKKRDGDWILLAKHAAGRLKDPYDNRSKIYEEYRDEYKKYWLEKYPASRIKGMIGSHNTWDARREWLGGRVVSTVDRELDDLYREVNAAIDVFWATESADAGSSNTFFDPVNNAVKFWLGLGGSDGNKNSLVVRTALLEMRAGDWISEYYQTGKSERYLLAVMYISELAEQTIGVLAADVGSTRKQRIAKVTSLANKFPLSRTSGQDITISEISEMQADLREISSDEPWPEFSIGDGKSSTTLDLSSLQIQLLFAKQMLEDIGTRQREISTAFKDLRGALQTTSGPDEDKRIKQIGFLLACLPGEKEVDECVVSVAAGSKGSHGMYTDFRIRYKGPTGKEERKRTSNYGASFSAEELFPSWDEFWVEVFPTADDIPKPEELPEYEKRKMRNRPRFGPYTGQWAFVRLIFSDDPRVSVRQSSDKSKWFVTFSLVFERDGGPPIKEELHLQLEFTKDRAPVKWPSLSEWPN